MSKITVAALQIGSDYRGKQATLANILSFEDAIASSGAALVVMPEALLGGYPKGEHFGTRLGFRLPEGREAFARYYDNAVDIDGPELAELADLGTRTGATLVVGVIERAGASLFCTAVFIEPERGVVAKHRKLMPTGTERLIWSQGDGSTGGGKPCGAGGGGHLLGKPDAAVPHRHVCQGWISGAPHGGRARGVALLDAAHRA
jgi:nitrilase